MGCNSYKPLEYQTLLKIAVTLWNNSDVTTLAKFHFQTTTCEEKRKEWEPIENQVIEKVSSLPLPKSIQNKVLPFIRPIGYQIFKWKECQNNILSEEALRHFCWTPQGSVDYKKTAEKIIGNENFEITRRYILACTNCIEDEIIALWKQIPTQWKKTFYLKSSINKPSLVQFWTAIMTKNLDKIPFLSFETSVWSYGFLVAIENKMKTAVEFFWLKLTDDEKDRYWSIAMVKIKVQIKFCILCNFFSNHYFADILCFLRSCVNERDNFSGFQNYGLGLVNFLEWPHQDCFLEIAKHPDMTFLEFDYDNIFSKIIHKVEEGFNDYDYSKLFREFWQLSPISYRSYSMNVVTLPSLLPGLFNIGDRETISFILKDVTPKEINHLAFLKWSKDICLILAKNGNWSLFEFFIAKFFPSEAKLIRFRDKYFKSAQVSCTKISETKEDIDSKIYLFINGLLINYSKKRKSEIINESPSKRSCKRYSLRNLKA